MKNQVIFFPYICICTPEKLPFGLLFRGTGAALPGALRIRGGKDTNKTLKMYLFVSPFIKCNNILVSLSFLFFTFSPVPALIFAVSLSTPYDIHPFSALFSVFLRITPFSCEKYTNICLYLCIVLLYTKYLQTVFYLLLYSCRNPKYVNGGNHYGTMEGNVNRIVGVLRC